MVFARPHMIIFIIAFLQGYNGSQLWDTAFAVQAIMSTNHTEQYGPILRRAHEYIKNSQVLWHRNYLLFNKGLVPN